MRVFKITRKIIKNEKEEKLMMTQEDIPLHRHQWVEQEDIAVVLEVQAADLLVWGICLHCLFWVMLYIH